MEQREDFVVRRARLRAPGGGLTSGEWDLQFRRDRLPALNPAWHFENQACIKNLLSRMLRT